MIIRCQATKILKNIMCESNIYMSSFCSLHPQMPFCRKNWNKEQSKNWYWLFAARMTYAQWYMVLYKRVQWVFFDNILTNWFHNFSSIPNKSFCGLVVRRPAFHTEIWGSIPPLAVLLFFKGFTSFSKIIVTKGNFLYYLRQNIIVTKGNFLYYPMQ